MEVVWAAIDLTRVAVADELLALPAQKVLYIVAEPNAERPTAVAAIVDIVKLQRILLLVRANLRAAELSLRINSARLELSLRLVVLNLRARAGRLRIDAARLVRYLLFVMSGSVLSRRASGSTLPGSGLTCGSW